MSQVIELRLEVEPISPDTPSTVSSLIKEAIDESITASGIKHVISPQELSIVFEQHLPTPQDLVLVVSIIQLMITADPQFFSRIKIFLDYLFANVKFKKAAPQKINAKISMGDKKIEVKNLSVEDAIK